MAFSSLEICNLAGGLLGGFGDQASATGEISSLTDGDLVSVACNREYPRARKQVIIDLALDRSPIRETIKNAELDDELIARDVVISNIVSASTVVTVTTKTVHSKSTGDTVVLKGIDADSGVGAADVGILNGVTRTITVTTTTAFTLDSTTGNDSFDYTEDSGVMSEVPEVGPWAYAFDQPSDVLAIVRVMDEVFIGDEDTRRQYRFSTQLNKDTDGTIILTNDLTNSDADGIYLEYAIDQTTGETASGSGDTLFGLPIVTAIATLLASYIAPVVGRDSQTRIQLLAEYKNVSIGEAASFNNKQVNRRAKRRKDLRGGRIGNLPSSTQYGRDRWYR